MYVIADIYQWDVLQGFNGYSVSVYWDPITVMLSFGRRIDGGFGEGVILMRNYSFMILLAIIVIDLSAVWRISRSDR
jgi:hypothetical protein